MIRPIVKMPVLLSAPSVDATPLDAAVGQDLLDTLAAHAHECVGLAANMIGVRKRIIVAACAGAAVLMYNPEIIEASGEYQTEESCLSLEGVRPCTRFKRIKVAYPMHRSHRAKSRFLALRRRSSSMRSTTATGL